MIFVCALASGSKGNAIYVANENSALLFDCGLSAIEIERRLLSINVEPKSLTAIVASHEHRDHIQGVAVMSRRFQLPVYITRPTLSAGARLLGGLHETRCFKPGTDFSINGLQIHPFPISHDAADPVGFTIEDRGNKIGIATDLGAPTMLVRQHLKGCRLIVLEANHDIKMLEQGPYPWDLKQRIKSRHGHLSNEASRDLLEDVADNQLEHVIVAHISETNNHPDKALSALKNETTKGASLKFTVGLQNKPSAPVCITRC